MRYILPLMSLLAFYLIWEYFSGFYTSVLFPSPADVGLAFRELAENDVLLANIKISLVRFISGYFLAIAAAIPLGLILGYYPLAHRAFDPVFQLLRPISPIAWFPLAVLWFGIGNAPAVFIIFLSAFFPVVFSTIDAVRQVPKVYLKVAANFGAGKRMIFLKVILPAAFPGIMVGLHIAVGTAWIHLVAGEMLGAQSGLGFLIVDSRNFMRTDWIMAGMLIIGVMGLGIYKLLKVFEKAVKKHWGGEAV